MATSTESCEVRLPAHLESRLDDFRSMTGWVNAWSQTSHHVREDDARQRLDEYPLAVSVAYSVKVELSTGGPADYLTAIVGRDGIESITYHFADWFDHAERSLSGEDFRAAETFIESTLDTSSLAEYIR